MPLPRDISLAQLQAGLRAGEGNRVFTQWLLARPRSLTVAGAAQALNPRFQLSAISFQQNLG
jgi:hypothetical protein